MNPWKSNSPLMTFSSPSPGYWPVQEGKGMPAGWVSLWGDKKVQKQTDGTWAHVPHETPVGMQPFFKGTGQSFSLTHDDEMMAFLHSVNFGDPEKQKALLSNPKWTTDVLKKFGAGFVDKFKKLSAQAPAPASPSAVPAETPWSSPPPPAAAVSPPEQAMKMLNVAVGSPEAFAIEQFHKTGDFDKTLDAYSKKHGIKFATAYDHIEQLAKNGLAKGVWSVSGDMFDGGAKVTFNVGTGPVISAPAIAATASAPSSGASMTAKQAAPAKLPAPAKAKKPAASTSTPVPVDPAVPPMKGIEAPIEPKVIALAQALGHKPDSDVAKILSVWRKRLQKGTPGIVQDTGKQIAAVSGWDQHAAHQFLLDLLSKAADTPGFNVSDFAVDSGASPGQKKPEPIATLTPSTAQPPAPPTTPPVVTPPGLTPAPEVPSLALDKAVSDMVAKLGYQMGSPAAVAVGMLTAHDGDITTSAKGMANALGWTEPQAFKVAKFVYAQMTALKAGMKTLGPTPAIDKLLHPKSGPRLPPPPPAAPPPEEPVPGVLPSIPPVVTLSYAGDAKTKLGGNKPKKFVKDEKGNLFLWKYGADQIRAAGGEVASTIALAVGGPTNAVPVKAVEYEGDWGTVQPMVPNLGSALPEDPTEWSADDINQLLRERVVDWVCSNHDSKIGNFIRTKKGQIYGIDKEQAFKFIGNDQLSLDYSPNPSDPIYNALFKAYANKSIELNPVAMLPHIQAVEKISDADWLGLVKTYLDALPESERDEKAKLILARKNSVRADFETFFTMLKKKRGEAGTFSFPGAPPPAPVVPVPATAPEPLTQKPPAAGLGVLVPPQVPPIASLTYSHKAEIGGAGEKHFFTDKNGKLWLLKVAANKGTKKPEPWKVGAQTLFAMVGKAVKPTTPPVGEAEYGGKPATIQPWLGDNLKTLAHVDPSDLTPSQKRDVADEHVLDWLLSQHDTHGGNLVILPDSGAVVGIDKEQGYKYLLPNSKWTSSSPEGDQLAVDYHPNAQYGEGEPYYNTFWKAFANGSMSFDPQNMKSAVEAVEKIPDDAFMNALSPYGAAAFPTDAVKAALFYGKAMERKKKIRAQFEGFITGLYKERTGKNGLFTFANGWVAEGASAPTPAGLPSVPAPAAAPQEIKPKTPPHPEAVPLPTGFVPPSNGAFNKFVSDLGWTKGSVYYPALKQLQLYNNNITDAANQLSFIKNLSPEVALKRVKYALKKLKTAGGWAVLEPSGTPAATAVPFAATNPPSTAVDGTPMTVFVPGSGGVLGNQSPQLVTPSDAYKPPPPPPPPPVPEGFTAPPEGKMWEVKKANEFFTTSGNLYKTKPPKLPDGTKDESSPNLVAKFKGTTVSAVTEALGQVGVASLTPLKEKGAHVIGLFEKTEWAKAQASDKKLGVLVDLPPPPPPPSGKFSTTPQAGSLKNAPASAGLKELAEVQDAQIGYGLAFHLGGKVVEQQSISVQRRIDSKGKFYRFMFKVREPYWKKLTGFTKLESEFKTASYNAKEDAFKELSGTAWNFKARRWTSADSVVRLSDGGEGESDTQGDSYSSYALRGMFVCDIRPEDGETPLEGLRKALKTVSPTFADQVLADPTPEDEQLMKLSALYWSAAPAEADGLFESHRNVAYLTDALKKLGYTQEQLDSMRFERACVDQVVPVLPGRGKKLQEKHDISHVAVQVDDIHKVMQQLRGGTIGCLQRLKHGVALAGTTSGKQDMERGGGDYVFTLPRKKDQSGYYRNWGDIEMCYDPSELDRLDCFMYDWDGYGNTKCSMFHERDPLEKNAGFAKEIIFRQGLSVNKLLKIHCRYAETAASLIKTMKDAGIEKVNGMTPEELVVTVGGSKFYDTYLKPSGY